MTELQVTTQEMRRSVKNWLTEEKATVEQALKLESALYAGAIEGSWYEGNREGRHTFAGAIRQYRRETSERPRTESGYGGTCGCLLDTLERIRHSRPIRDMSDDTAKTFSLAMMIGLGDTPYNSKWARAAAKGIEDYLATQEVAVA